MYIYFLHQVRMGQVVTICCHFLQFISQNNGLNLKCNAFCVDWIDKIVHFTDIEWVNIDNCLFTVQITEWNTCV